MKRLVFGVVLIVLAIAGLFFWETEGRERFTYDEILVLAEPVEKSTIITAEMLTTDRVAVAHPNAYRKDAVEQIIGKETTQYISDNTQLFPQCFEDTKLIAHKEKDEYVLSIPGSWLESYPQTLRRGDTVYFWCEGKRVTSATVVFVKDSTNTEVTSDDDRLTASSRVSLVEIIATEKKANTLAKLAEDGNKFVILYN